MPFRGPRAHDVAALAEHAFVFGYPLVLMDATCAWVVSSGRGIRLNQFIHNRKHSDAGLRGVLEPNADMLTSTAWLDLSRGPVLLSLPDTHGRYYLMEMLDAWSEVFACPGRRTTGTIAREFAILGPRSRAILPPGVTELRSPTNLAWIVGRTQSHGALDLHEVHALQDRYRLRALDGRASPPVSSRAGDRFVVSGGAPLPGSAAGHALPLQVDNPAVDMLARMDANTFFGRLAALLPANPPARADPALELDLAHLGVRRGRRFRPDPAFASDLAEGVARARARIESAALGELKRDNGWAMALGLGDYGTNYLKRAAVAWLRLGAELDVDAVCAEARTDSEGRALVGTRRYRVHFEPGQTPPVDACWSVTLFDSKHAFWRNALERYAIGDRDAMEYNPDGSLDVYVQHERPPEGERNWLPAPRSMFSLMLQMYQPHASVHTRTWHPPRISQRS